MSNFSAKDLASHGVWIDIDRTYFMATVLTPSLNLSPCSSTSFANSFFTDAAGQSEGRTQAVVSSTKLTLSGRPAVVVTALKKVLEVYFADMLNGEVAETLMNYRLHAAKAWRQFEFMHCFNWVS